MSKEINAHLSIHRTTSSNEGSYVSIEIGDRTSGITFLRAKMSMETFAHCITGLSHCDMTAEVFGLEHVGMSCIRESRSVLCPLSTHKREELSQWLKDNAQEEGWIVSTYLGAQGSVKYDGDKTRLNYSVVKYVPSEDPALAAAKGGVGS